jgi:hypothetical protein
VLLQDGENAVLGSRWLDGQAREVAGERWADRESTRVRLRTDSSRGELEEIELFVARACPEIVSMNNGRLFLFVAKFVDNSNAALFSERWIGQHHLVFAVFAGERVFHHHRHVCRTYGHAFW